MRVAGLFEDDLFSQRQRKRGSVALLVAIETRPEWRRKVLAHAETVRADIKISLVPRGWADCWSWRSWSSGLVLGTRWGNLPRGKTCLEKVFEPSSPLYQCQEVGGFIRKPNARLESKEALCVCLR